MVRGPWAGPLFDGSKIPTMKPHPAGSRCETHDRFPANFSRVARMILLVLGGEWASVMDPPVHPGHHVLPSSGSSRQRRRRAPKTGCCHHFRAMAQSTRARWTQAPYFVVQGLVFRVWGQGFGVSWQALDGPGALLDCFWFRVEGLGGCIVWQALHRPKPPHKHLVSRVSRISG